MSKLTRRLFAAFGLAVSGMTLAPGQPGRLPEKVGAVDPDSVRCTAEEACMPVGEPAPVKTEACPANMVLVEGQFCPDLQQTCISWPPAGQKYDVCDEYAAPTKCLSEQTVPMRFCIDKYEHSSDGKLPDVLISFNKLNNICESEGKRLCTDIEFTQACRGPENNPFPTGYKRDTQACQLDYPLVAWDQNRLKEPGYLETIDRREPIGSHPACVSGYGVYDLTGSVDENTRNVGLNGHPHENALKGGHYMHGRNRCDPGTYEHDENYILHLIGGRCCSDPQDMAVCAKPAVVRFPPGPK